MLDALRRHEREGVRINRGTRHFGSPPCSNVHRMENWLSVVGYEGFYEVSDEGRVRSLDRVVMSSNRHNPNLSPRRYPGKLLTPIVTGNGDYLGVTLSRRGYTRKLIHHLVLEAFVGPRPDGSFGLHHDDDPSNNRLSNLRWGTKGENQDDKVRNGNHHNVLKTHCPQEHEYTPENTRWDSRPNGRKVRRCVTCIREQGRKSYHRNK